MRDRAADPHIAEARLRTLLDAALDAVIWIDDSGTITDWSASAERMFGWTRQDAIGRSLASTIVPERYRDAHTSGLRRFLATGEGRVVGRRVELEGLRRDGQELPIELTVVPLRIDGRYTFAAFVRDISGRRAAERRRLAFEAINEVAYAAGKPLEPDRLARFVVTYVRDLYAVDVVSLFWRDPAGDALQLVASSGGGLAEPARRQPRGRVATRAFRTGSPVVLDAREERSAELTDISGTVVAVPLLLEGHAVGAFHLRSAAVRDDTDELVRTLAVFASQVAPLIEVSRLHDALRQEEERFQKAFERNPTGLTIARQSDRAIVEANAAFLEMIGYERDEVIGRRAAEVGFHDNDVMVGIRRELDAAGMVRGRELTLRTKLGGTREVIASFELAQLRGDAMIIGNFLDVTERRAAERRHEVLERRLRQAERMESLGQLAGGVAHDFNNLLAVIINFARFALDDLPAAGPARAEVEEIFGAAQRAAALTRQLLTFSRREVTRPEPLDVGAVVRDVEQLLRRTIGDQVRLELTVASDLWPVVADATRLEQIVMNLAVNARDAMPEGGLLTIAVSNVETREAEGTLDLRPGRYVLLTVADTGLGMTEDVQQHAFEPFFTTKPKGSGTGLGLATVYGSVTQAGGRIHLYSEPGHGTVFRVYLPASGSAVVDRSAAPPAPPAASAGESILVVEDDPQVRAVAVRILRTHGYDVVEAGDPASALDAMDARAVGLLLTDVVMPTMSGRELAARLRRSLPDLRVLYMSGYAEQVMRHEGSLDAPLLEKPFTREALLEKVRAALSRAPAGEGSPER